MVSMVMTRNHKIDALEPEGFLKLIEVYELALVGVPENGMSAVGYNQVADTGLPYMLGDLPGSSIRKLPRRRLQNANLPIIKIVEFRKFCLQRRFPSDRIFGR